MCFHIFFFFQAEDGIRDWSVTGVQTCALPISLGAGNLGHATDRDRVLTVLLAPGGTKTQSSRGRRPTSGWPDWSNPLIWRSEERRVGKEGRGRWSGDVRIRDRT